MQINEAKNIPVEVLAEKLGARYSHTDRQGDKWYYSPFRPDEKTASFKINAKKNSWHDFGISNTFAHQKQSNGGDILDLWCDYHFKDRRFGIKEALEAVKSLVSSSIKDDTDNTRLLRAKPANIKPTEPRYKIVDIDDRIYVQGLKEELSRRRIDLKLASLYLNQGRILDKESGKKYTGFLFENDRHGYEVSIPNPKSGSSFKTCIGQKASTRILTIKEDTNAADVFEGFWDFLTLLQLKGRMHPTNHSYILNSTSLVGEACEKIKAFEGQVKYVFLFMDNDEAGFLATHAIAANLEEDFNVASWEQFYKGYKDLSEFWMSKHSFT
ncbi:toprim domain-containing protein [Mucilaginibacter sp. 44-25]|uniref:toprim domain-containing protein n=1 Tax=Mucilaginibacter sp. 44-25 TaxID=1895794 RepID=UPI00095E4722|nr:toprim domain-containing protein [Mucilaginibacter sp. 44-25]OJW12508.1 MAG: hypothetical protein BGO48_05280 [Mucilaginibacter sp. 44-25]